MSNVPYRFIKCLKDRGLKYTFKRSIFHINKKINNESTLNNNESEYIKFIEEAQKNRYSNIKPEFVEMSKDDYIWKDDSPKVIAWYLPQYYQMEVNNKYHGQGFTEWTNTTQTMPQFTGHYQPHIPYDVGYYDLSNVEALKRQAYLAKKYGIYGFAFHWYWFSGERTMEIPPQILLEHPEIDIHYFFDWATENWTSAWDGGTKEIIFEQGLKKDDAEKLMKDLLPFFNDSRYIKIDGKPVLSLYRCDMFEKSKYFEFVKELRLIAKREGFPDLYLMLTNRIFDGDVTEWGMDALVEFPPCWMYGYCYRPDELDVYTSPNLKADFFDVTPFIESKLYYKNYPSKDIYRSALVGFDNSARRATTGCQIVLNDTPEKFEAWLRGILVENKSIHRRENNFVFVNSWNEWAEGSHLEPDMKYGYAYLQAVKNALENYDCFDVNVIEREINAIKERRVCVYIHCIESMGDVIAAEPISRFIKKTYPDIELKWIVKEQYADIVRYNPNIDKLILVKSLGESIDLCKKVERQNGNVVVDCHYNGRICSKSNVIHENCRNIDVDEKTYLYFGSLLESFCLTAGMKPIDETPKFYLSEDKKLDTKLPAEYIVIHCKSAEACKDWTDEKWNILIQKIINDGYNIVEIGMHSDIKVHSDKYYNCTDIHDLQKIAFIIKKSSGYIGVDSGFAHIANAFSIPAVLIFGEYKNFKRPLPYSGNYKSKRFADIVYANRGKAENVYVDDIYMAVSKRFYKK